jgi:hypothetical protein
VLEHLGICMSEVAVPNEDEDTNILLDDVGDDLDGYESSSEEEEVIGRHTHISCTLDKISISINGVKARMLENAKNDIRETLAKARRKLRLSAEDSPDDLNSIINIFLRSSFLVKLLENINRAFTVDGNTNDGALTMTELQECLRILFALHYYKCSANMLFSVEAKLMYSFTANVGYNVYKRFIKGLSYTAKQV